MAALTIIATLLCIVLPALSEWTCCDIPAVFRSKVAEVFKSHGKVDLDNGDFDYDHSLSSGTGSLSDGKIIQLDELIQNGFAPGKDETGGEYSVSLDYHYQIDTIKFKYRVTINEKRGTVSATIPFKVYNAILTVTLHARNDKTGCKMSQPKALLTLQKGEYDYELDDVDSPFYLRPVFELMRPAISVIIWYYMGKDDKERLPKRISLVLGDKIRRGVLQEALDSTLAQLNISNTEMCNNILSFNFS